MSVIPVDTQLATRGHAVLPNLLDARECATLAALFEDDSRFRATIDMARYRFGQGVYRYFEYPLPALVETLREAWYATLVPLANQWAEALGKAPYPGSHAEFLAACQAAGQRRATPLLLRYGPGDFNCLHQDLYGACAFPLQLICLLSEPGATSRAASSFLPNSGRARSRYPTCCRFARATPR